MKFVVGGAIGTAIGLVVASLAAPKNGAEFQDDVRRRLADSKAAGAEAERQTIANLEQRFRNQVGDYDALKGTPAPEGTTL
ncbi:MAG TPA: YtxH domain-containing protein [Thermomicrobiales bacterium]|nr:YtxH domain-containing protein [Thermomicrobiales bacterium]